MQTVWFCVFSQCWNSFMLNCQTCRSIPQWWRRLSLCSPFILVYFIREFKTGSRQTGMQSQKASNSTRRFPSRPCTLPLFPTKITPLSVLPHLHPYSTISLLSACLISTNPFLLGFIKAFITFHIKRTGSISPPFCNVAHLRQRIGAISDLSTFLSWQSH